MTREITATLAELASLLTVLNYAEDLGQEFRWVKLFCDKRMLNLKKEIEDYEAGIRNEQSERG